MFLQVTACNWSHGKGPFVDPSSCRLSPLLSGFGMGYPCGKCKDEVGKDDEGIQCEGQCQYWYHCACEGIDDHEYDCLSSSEGKWECSRCTRSDLPALNSVDAVDVFHFDFQMNLPTLKLTVGQGFMQGYSGPTSLVSIQHLPR